MYDDGGAVKSFSSLFARARCLPVEAEQPGQAYIIHMTVDAASVTTLRQLAMRVCGAALEYMRVAMRGAGAGARMRVWLCVRSQEVELLRETLVRQLPGVEVRESCCMREARA